MAGKLSNVSEIGKELNPHRDGIGAVAMAWAVLEYSLAHILAELLETDGVTSTVVSAALPYNRKRDLINSLAEGKLRNSAAQKSLAAFMGDVKGMATERNEIVHGLWAAEPRKGSKRLILISMRNQGSYQQQHRPMAAGHLHGLAKRTNKLANAGLDVAVEVRRAVRAWREKHPPLIPPHLVDELRHEAATQGKPPTPPESSGA